AGDPLPPQTEPSDQAFVAARVLLAQIVEQTAALAYHNQQAAARVNVLLVGLQVPREVADPLAQDRHLYLRRTGVALLGTIFPNQFLLALGRNRHRLLLSV